MSTSQESMVSSHPPCLSCGLELMLSPPHKCCQSLQQSLEFPLAISIRLAMPKVRFMKCGFRHTPPQNPLLDFIIPLPKIPQTPDSLCHLLGFPSPPLRPKASPSPAWLKYFRFLQCPSPPLLALISLPGWDSPNCHPAEILSNLPDPTEAVSSLWTVHPLLRGAGPAFLGSTSAHSSSPWTAEPGSPLQCPSTLARWATCR